MCSGVDDVLDVVLILELRARNTTSTATLDLERVGRNGLDVTLGRHRDDEVFIIDEIFDVEVADVEGDLATSRLSEGFANLAHFFSDNCSLLAFIAQNGFEVSDGFAQLRHFFFELRAAQSGETRQLHIENVFGLFGREFEWSSHKRFASSLLIG
ncbi:unannotated protein [freshwater metagenome]|uniref:Unannotated protein n=1 Tax=freshwater metagenome TaxID=449393 RepID=A0A6J6C4V2_9ZZZZ